MLDLIFKIRLLRQKSQFWLLSLGKSFKASVEVDFAEPARPATKSPPRCFFGLVYPSDRLGVLPRWSWQPSSKIQPHWPS